MLWTNNGNYWLLQNGWISNHIIKIKNSISPNYNASFFGRVFNFCPYIHHRTKKKHSEIIYIPWNRKKNQQWYFQIQVKFQMDFTHLSEGDRFFYIHSKLKNKIFNQMQIWIKIMTEREKFSMQRFVDQLILIYVNFLSMELATKKLNNMKQWNKHSFSTFISGFEKKNVGNGWNKFQWLNHENFF